MIHDKTTIRDTTSYTFFFIRISKVLDKIRSSNVKKKKSSIDIDDVLNDINKCIDDSDDEAEDDLNERNGDEEK